MRAWGKVAEITGGGRCAGGGCGRREKGPTGGPGWSAASARAGVRGRPRGEQTVLRERLLGRRAQHGPCERDGRRRRAGRGAGIWAGPGIAGPRGKKRRFGPTGLLCGVGLDC